MRTRTGRQLFASYAYPPNELGYCGPPDSTVLLDAASAAEIDRHARGFDGAWPYLEEIAAAAGIDDPIDAEVVRAYWLGGPLLSRVDGTRLVTRLRQSFAGQPTGLLEQPGLDRYGQCDHSFHVFVVYPWIRFLGQSGDPHDATTPLRILQSCRIRWGTVESVDDEHAVLLSPPLTFDGATLRLGAPIPETVRWAHAGRSLTAQPRVGETIAAHWGWVCDRLDTDQCAGLAAATATTLDLVNRLRVGAQK